MTPVYRIIVSMGIIGFIVLLLLWGLGRRTSREEAEYPSFSVKYLSQSPVRSVGVSEEWSFIEAIDGRLLPSTVHGNYLLSDHSVVEYTTTLHVETSVLGSILSQIQALRGIQTPYALVMQDEISQVYSDLNLMSLVQQAPRDWGILQLGYRVGDKRESYRLWVPEDPVSGSSVYLVTKSCAEAICRLLIRADGTIHLGQGPREEDRMPSNSDIYLYGLVNRSTEFSVYRSTETPSLIPCRGRQGHWVLGSPVTLPPEQQQHRLPPCVPQVRIPWSDVWAGDVTILSTTLHIQLSEILVPDRSTRLSVLPGVHVYFYGGRVPAVLELWRLVLFPGAAIHFFPFDDAHPLWVRWVPVRESPESVEQEKDSLYVFGGPEKSSLVEKPRDCRSGALACMPPICLRLMDLLTLEGQRVSGRFLPDLIL